jgi:hypothetical protein
MSMKELDVVVLTKNLPDEALTAGDVGTIVGVYAGGKGYEVEFTSFEGSTVSVATVDADAIRPVTARDIKHVRSFETRPVSG